MAKPKQKFSTLYQESDLASHINDFLLGQQSPEGEAFKCVHILAGTLIVKISNQTFIISITDKNKLS